MSYQQIILSSHTLNEGRILINQWLTSGNTVFSAGTGTGSIKAIAGSSVAAGSYSFVIGKSNSISVGTYSNILNGSGCSITQSWGFIGSGKVNTVSGLYGVTVGGWTNSATAVRMGFVGNGKGNIAGTGNYTSIVNGKTNTCSGAYSSILAGFNGTASGGHAVILAGQSNTSSGNFSLTMGTSNVASGTKSAALGTSNTASASHSVVWGASNTSSHAYAFAFGKGAASDAAYQMVFAQTAGNNTVKIDYNVGRFYCDTGLYSTGADVAELFEWADGNVDNEFRIGFAVSLNKDGKIFIGGSNTIGIISATPAILGDAGELGWKHKYEVDEWGFKITEKFKKFYSTELETHLFIDLENNFYSGHPMSVSLKEKFKINPPTEIPDNFEEIEIQKLNPSYDQNSKYVSRSSRKEFAAVGFLGKIKVRTAEKIKGTLVDFNINGMAVSGGKYHVLETNKEFDGKYGIVTIFFK